MVSDEVNGIQKVILSSQVHLVKRLLFTILVKL